MSAELKKALPMPGNFPVAVDHDDEEILEYWQEHVDSWHRSGLTQAAYCREHNLDYKHFCKLKARLSSDPTVGTSIKLVEVKRDFTLNRNAGSYSPPPPPAFAPGFNTNSKCGNGVARASGYPGINETCTGGSSGIHFWCGEFCIEVDVKFSSATLRQLIQALEGIYIKNEGDAGHVENAENAEADQLGKE